MTVLRWMLFLPGGLLAGVLLSSLPHILNIGILYDLEPIKYLVSGVFGSVGTIYIGLKVAPEKTDRVKLILCVTLILLCVLAISGILASKNAIEWRPVAPIFAIVIAAILIKTPVSNLKLQI